MFQTKYVRSQTKKKDVLNALLVSVLFSYLFG